MFQRSESKEKRLISLFKEVGSNAKTWGKDINDTYISGAIRNKDPIQMVTGPVIAAASTVFELPDYLYAGIADEKLELPNGNFGRTGRDIGAIMQNNVRHPIRTVLSGLRLLSDIPLDAADTIGGFRRGGRGAMQNVLER